MNGSLPKGSVRRVARGDGAAPKSALAALRQTVEAFNERLKQQFAQTPPLPNETRLAIFTAGLPGAGKSTLVKKRYGQDEKYRIVDPDIIAETCAVPYDPEYPQPAHEQTREIAEAKFKEALGGKRPHVIIDTTGSKADKLIRRMEAARSAGFRIRLLYVTVPIDLSLSRNRLRERHVPEHIIYEKAAEINEAFEKVRAHADEIEVVDNTKASNPGHGRLILNPKRLRQIWKEAATEGAHGGGGVRLANVLDRVPSLMNLLWDDGADGIRVAAHVAHLIIFQQPFKDCNHRTAWLTALTILGRTGYDATATPAEDVRTKLRSVDGGKATADELEAWLRLHAKALNWARTRGNRASSRANATALRDSESSSFDIIQTVVEAPLNLSQENPNLEVRPAGSWVRERITDPRTGALTAHARKHRKDMVADYIDRSDAKLVGGSPLAERGKPGFYQFMRTQTSGKHRLILGRIRGTGRLEVQSILHPLSEKASLAQKYGPVEDKRENPPKPTRVQKREAQHVAQGRSKAETKALLAAEFPEMRKALGVEPSVRNCPNGCGDVRYNGRRTVDNRRGVLTYTCRSCKKTFANAEMLR